MREITKLRIIACALLVLFLAFQGGRTMCYHTHVTGDKIISHSHPFNNPDRQHTNSELEAFAMIGLSSLTDDSSSEPLLPAVPAVTVERAVCDSGNIRLGFTHVLKGRDPPASPAV